MKNERGFTLIEMLVVLLIISILILVTIPNVTKHSAMVNNKGCSAYVQMLQGMVETYRLEKGNYPTTFNELKNAEYIKEDTPKCPNGKAVKLANGIVSEDTTTPPASTGD